MTQRWSVGALARATGLTVRTLHHYDDLGLLRPSERTASGHRRYTEADLRRLYRVRVLRGLGLPLEEIGAVLDKSADLRALLERRLERLDDEIWRLNLLSRQVRGLLEQAEPHCDELLTRLGRTSQFHDQLDRRQHDLLHERAEALGPDGREWLDAEWPAVLTALAEHCRADTPVDDPRVREVLGRLVNVLRAFTGGDPSLQSTVARFFREHADSVVGDEMPELADLGPRIHEYVSRAFAH